MNKLTLTFLAASAALIAQGTSAVEFPSTTNASQVGVNFVMGYQFTVTSPITVSALGAVLLDSPDQAVFGVLPASMQVGLWDASQNLLVSATVTTANPLSGHFNYAPVQATPLTPGMIYTIAGLVLSGKSVLSNIPNPAFDPQVTFVGPVSAVLSTLSFPGTANIANVPNYFGASFQYSGGFDDYDFYLELFFPIFGN